MVATWCLLSWMLVPGQAPERPAPVRPASRSAQSGSWQLGVRLEPAQELVYRGSYSEESRIDQVSFRRAYRIELHLLVLESNKEGAQVAFMTELKHTEPQGVAQVGLKEETAAALVRMETAWVSPQGRIRTDPGTSFQIPLEGAPTLECGGINPLPAEQVVRGQPWEVYEVGRPPQVWQITGQEMLHGTRCLILEGAQQSPEWEKPRADRPAWQRKEKIWLSEQHGHPVRLERIIEKREPARTEASYRSVMRYDLESSLRYPGQLFGDRRDEIILAQSLEEESSPLMARPNQHTQRFDALLSKIRYHEERHPPTPYRQALVQTKRLLEAARRGEAPITLTSAKPSQARVATIGEPAPDFVASSFTESKTARLQSWLGRPVLMVFYRPKSVITPSLLRHVQKIQTSLAGKVQVVGMAVSNDPREVLDQRGRLGLTFPLVNGTGLRNSYAVETTPRIVLLDASGAVRASYLGWGQEIPEALATEMKRWLPQH